MPRRRPDAAELVGRGGWIGVRPLTLARLRGKAVVVHFWSGSCVPCLRVIDELRPLQDLYAEEAVVVGVHTPQYPAEAAPGAAAAAVAAHRVTHPVLDDPDGATAAAYGVTDLPTIVLVDPLGRVAGQVAGDGVGELLRTGVAQVLEQHDAAGGRRRRRVLEVERALLPVGLAFPGKVAVSPDGRRLAVADTANDRVVVCSLDGVVLEVHTGYQRPQGVRFDPDGASVLICDTGADRVVRTGGVVLADGLSSPWDLAGDGRSFVVASAGDHRLLRVRPGEISARVVAGTGAEGTEDGPAAKALLSQPSGVARTDQGWVFVDAGAGALRLVVEDRRGAEVSTLVDEGLQHPLGVAAGPGGGPVYVADTLSSVLRVWDGRALRTLPVDGLARPGGLDVLPDGRLVVADTNHHRVVVVDPATGAVAPVDMDETWVHAGDRPALSAGAGRRLTVEAVLELVDERLDPSRGVPVEVVVTARPAALLAGGRTRVELSTAGGPVEITAGGPGSGLLLVEVTARTVGAAGPTVRVQRRRHTFDVTP